LLNKLSTFAVKAAATPGWYGDGDGLWLRVDPAGSKRWVFIYQWRGRRAEMGLGSAREVDLKEARAGREAARRAVRDGLNPVEVRRRARADAQGSRTFSEWAEEIAPDIGPKAEKARKAWLAMMQTKVGDFAELALADITTQDVLRALKPYWVSRPESGQRMRQRIERVLDAAKSKGLIADPWQNPARLKGHLENLLQKRAKPVSHRAALPYAEAPGFMAKLKREDRPAARLLEFTILTAVRNIEARGATWAEIDWKEKIWTIPAARMKGEEHARREHRVPLSEGALALLKKIRPSGAIKGRDFIFPCPAAAGGMFSENALQGVLNDMGLKGRATVHGFRSSFRDWAGETTEFQRETIEAALAHQFGDQTERAYRRGDELEKRRQLMAAWAIHLQKRAGPRRL
jgi:integrase